MVFGAMVDMPPQHGSNQQTESWRAKDVSVDGESQKDLI